MKMEKRGQTNEFLYPTGTNLGILYGLPKVHKENWLIRPILSAVNTPNYLLAKYLVPNLTFLTKNEFMVNSSFDFAKEIVNFNPKGLHMASFDVTSLFTRESRCLAGEPKHFPFAIVFVLIIKITQKLNH